MDEKANTPSIRFAGFTDAWEQCKLNELADIIGGGTPNTNNPDYWDGKIDWYAPAEMEGQRYAVGSVRKITELGLRKSSAQILPAGKTVLFTSRAGIGKMALLQHSAATNQGFQSLVLKDGFSPYFIYSLGGNIKEAAEAIASGSTFLEISGRMLGNLSFAIPSEEEQNKIADYFRQLDDLIALHQRKYDKLVNLKKSLLEKMFPQHGADVPEIRFAGFTDAWERRKVGDIVTDVERPITMKDEKVYQLVTVKRRNEGVVSRGFLKGKDILVKNYFMIHEGDYLISKRQVIHGANGYVPKELNYAVVSNEYMVAVSNKFVSSKFWVLMSKRKEMYRMFLLSSYGVDIEKMVFNVDDWKKRFVMIPSMSEQNRIISFFEHLDTLITLHQRKLTKLQNIKKSCLEKMFI